MMLAIILVFAGAVCGGITLLFTGVPLVLLNTFRILPFDRRIWWCFAAALAYFVTKDMIFSSYDYKVPSAKPDSFYFDAHLLGGAIGVGITFVLGMAILFFVGQPNQERQLNLAISVPTTTILMLGGVAMAAQLAQPAEAKRAKLEAKRDQLVAAITSGQAQAVRDCLAKGIRLRGKVAELGGRSMMGYAISQQNAEVVRVLLDPPRGRKEDVNARWFREVLKTGNEPLVEVFLSSPNGDAYVGRLLRAAIANNDANYFRKAVALGADPDACESYDTPLTLCAKHNRVVFAEELLSLGANPNKFHGSPDLNRGCTPLITAADHGHFEMVELLLDQGAGVNQTKAGHRSALLAACRSCHPEIVERLINAGAALDHQTNTKATALHLTIEPDTWNKDAPESTKVTIVRLLLAAGIDRSVKYRYGTALEVARRHKLTSVAEILANDSI